MYTLTILCALSVTTPGEKSPEPFVQYAGIGDKLPEGAIRRLGEIRYHTSYPIETATLSPDGTTLAIVDQTGSFTIMDARTGRIQKRIAPTGVTARNIAIEFLPDGNRLAVTGKVQAHIWQLWDISQSKKVHAFTIEKGDRPVSVVSEEGSILAVGHRALNLGPEILIYDPASGKKLTTLETLHTGPMHLAMTPNGQLLASGGGYTQGESAERIRRGQIVHIWELPEGKEARQIKVKKGEVVQVAFAPDNKTLALLDSYGWMEIWDATTGKQLHRWQTKVFLRGFLKFSPDGTKLLGAPAEKGVTVWDVPTGKVLAECDTQKLTVTGVGFRNDGTILACTPQDHAVHLWDVTAHKRLTPEKRMVAPADLLAFSRDGKSLVATHRFFRLRRWDIATGDFTQATPKGDIWPNDLKGGPGFAVGFGLSPRGTYFVAAGKEGALLVFDVTTGKLIRTFETAVGSVGQVAFSGDESQLCVIANPSRWGQGANGRTEVLNLKSGKSVTLDNVPDQPLGVTFAFDGSRVAIASREENQGNSGGEIGIWDPLTGKRLIRLKPTYMARGMMRLTPDGRHLINMDATNGLEIWDTLTGRRIQEISCGTGARPYPVMGVSPDGRSVAMAVYETRNRRVNGLINVAIKVYELASGELRYRFDGHPQSIRGLAYSPDGRILASAGADPTILLWDASLPRPDKRGLTAKEAAKIWDQLRKGDAQQAATMMGQLIANPEEALALFTQELQPIPRPEIDRDKVQELITNLGSDRFAVREKAYGELLKLGMRVEKELIEALNQKPNAEAKRRLEQLIQVLESREITPADIRHIRAVEVLEHIGTDSARNHLRKLAEGDPQAILTQEAIATLKRMEEGE